MLMVFPIELFSRFKSHYRWNQKDSEADEDLRCIHMLISVCSLPQVKSHNVEQEECDYLSYLVGPEISREKWTPISLVRGDGKHGD